MVILVGAVQLDTLAAALCGARQRGRESLDVGPVLQGCRAQGQAHIRQDKTRQPERGRREIGGLRQHRGGTSCSQGTVRCHRRGTGQAWRDTRPVRPTLIHSLHSVPGPAEPWAMTRTPKTNGVTNAEGRGETGPWALQCGWGGALRRPLHGCVWAVKRALLGEGPPGRSEAREWGLRAG